MEYQATRPRTARPALTLAAIGLLASLSIPAAVVGAPAEKAKGDASPVIAKVKGDQVRILQKRLRTQLEDGRSIKTFRITRRGDGYELLRVSEVDGRRFTEGIPLELDADGESLRIARPKIADLKWITTCSQGSCEGFCTPDGDHCDCYSGSGGGLPDIGSIFDVEQAHASDVEAGVSGDCTFGSAGGGLYDVIILH